MIKKLEEIGRYVMLMGRVFSKPVKRRILLRQIFDEMEKSGLNSIGIVTIISFFIGTVVVIQMAINLDDPLLPKDLIGYATRETIILEFSSTIVALILAGKVGSNIASEIGSMRITQQIDALEIMGVNSANYLILPKIIASVVFFPMLTILSMFLGIFGGYVSTLSLSSVSPENFVQGVCLGFKPFSVFYGATKALAFGFLVSSISAYYGYYAAGSSLEVGRSSTKAVVTSIIVVLIFNLIITKLFYNY